MCISNKNLHWLSFSSVKKTLLPWSSKPLLPCLMIAWICEMENHFAQITNSSNMWLMIAKYYRCENLPQKCKTIHKMGHHINCATANQKHATHLNRASYMGVEWRSIPSHNLCLWKQAFWHLNYNWLCFLFCFGQHWAIIPIKKQ